MLKEQVHEKKEEVLIKQLGLLYDSTIAQIYEKTPEDIAKLREKLLYKC